MSEQLPPPDRQRIRATPCKANELLVLAPGTRVMRVHALGGPHPTAWDELRSFGPTGSRFDHQTLPRRVHPSRAVAYLTFGNDRFPAAIAEFFQDENGGIGPIDRAHRAPAITQFALAAEVRLLDLESGWMTRAGGNQAITSGSRSRSREWARAIYAERPEVGGVSYGSSVWAPGLCAALWDRGAPALPEQPLASRALNDSALDTALENAAEELGTFTV